MDNNIKEAKIKIASYCAYQERCHSEVTTKLYEYGLFRDQVEEVIAWLITENYLNEERFASTFAGGKFRVKKWGNLKIRRALEQKRVSEYSISKALKELDGENYLNTIKELIVAQQRKIKDPNVYIVRNKVARHIIGKGFEPEAVWQQLMIAIPE